MTPAQPAQSVLSISTTLLVLAVTLALWFFWMLYDRRTRIRGLPGPPHSFIWGHLKAFGEIRKEFPVDVHGHTLPSLIQRKYNLPEIFYLDLWPISYQFLIIGTADAAQQVQNMPKHVLVTKFTDYIAGEHNLVSMHGPEWKKWRSIFNPGFAVSHLMTLVPHIVEEVEIFCRILDQHAKTDDVVRLEITTTNLTVDIIGRVVLDLHFHQQTSNNEYVSHVMAIVERKPLSDEYPDPFHIAYCWYHRRAMSKYLVKFLRGRLASGTGADKQSTRKRNVVDLALESFKAGYQAQEAQQLDPEFIEYAIQQMNIFIFAGHDTTSSVICYAYHMLSKHPDSLEKMIREHDEVFGKDLSEVPQLLQTQPHLINKLEYTMAVIKEILRMFPPASGIRRGSPDFSIHDPKTGMTYPTGFQYSGDVCLWINHVSTHRSSTNFALPDCFIPERFLSPSSPYYLPLPNTIPANSDINLHTYPPEAFRPFERGPRGCIGQEFALIEARIVLLMTVRKYDIRAVYGTEDFEKLRPESGWKKDQGGDRKVFGEEAYQMLKGTGKPRQGLPARVALRKR